MELENIAVFIKEKRKERNLTQVELAKKLYVTEKAISRWETGRGTPDVSYIQNKQDNIRNFLHFFSIFNFVIIISKKSLSNQNRNRKKNINFYRTSIVWIRN